MIKNFIVIVSWLVFGTLGLFNFESAHRPAMHLYKVINSMLLEDDLETILKTTSLSAVEQATILDQFEFRQNKRNGEYEE